MATPIPDNDTCFTAAELHDATGAESSLAGEVRGVVIDSRRVTEGCLFVPLRGQNHDAHDFVEDAARRGAAAVMADRDVECSVPVIRVADTLRGLGALGAAHRRRFPGLDVIGVTGSVGKTTTKELLGAALRGLGRAPLITRGNLNNRVGVPMTLLTLGSSHDAAVIEMGMNEPGEIADLAAMARPRVGLVTSVAEVHTEGVGDLRGVAREKGALLMALDATGTAVWNRDDAPLQEWAEHSPAGQKISFGRSEDAALRLIGHALDGSGTSADLSLDGRAFSLRLSLLGAHTAMNAAGALAAIAALDMSALAGAVDALADVAPPAHRMQPVQAGSKLLIDDSYNASPRSIVAALEACRELAMVRGGGVVAVLGDMLELGSRETALHAEIGRAAIASGVKALVVCGERMTHAGRAALEATMAGSGPRAKIVLLRDVEPAAQCVRELAGPQDVVLIKGSRGMRMERVVTALEEAP